jgi:hypothetical protein
MAKSNFTVTVSSKKTPAEIFQILLNVRSWWSGLYGEEFTGSSAKAGDVFTFKAGNGAHYTVQKLIELIPDKKVVWLVTESDLTFLEKTDEWTGTKLIFEITQAGGNTEVKFIHKGLTTQSECYDNCAPAWTQYIQTRLSPLLNDQII